MEKRVQRVNEKRKLKVKGSQQKGGKTASFKGEQLTRELHELEKEKKVLPSETDKFPGGSLQVKYSHQSLYWVILIIRVLIQIISTVTITDNYLILVNMY